MTVSSRRAPDSMKCVPRWSRGGFDGVVSKPLCGDSCRLSSCQFQWHFFRGGADPVIAGECLLLRSAALIFVSTAPSPLNSNRRHAAAIIRHRSGGGQALAMGLVEQIHSARGRPSGVAAEDALPVVLIWC